jgi:hypothetical protein
MKLSTIRKSPLITNIWSRILFFTNIGLLSFIAFYTIFFTRVQDSAIPITYSSLKGFELNQWYHTTSYIIFALVATITNVAMAHILTSHTAETDQPLISWQNRLLVFNLFLLLMVLIVLRNIVRTL